MLTCLPPQFKFASRAGSTKVVCILPPKRKWLANGRPQESNNLYWRFSFAVSLVSAPLPLCRRLAHKYPDFAGKQRETTLPRWARPSFHDVLTADRAMPTSWEGQDTAEILPSAAFRRRFHSANLVLFNISGCYHYGHGSEETWTELNSWLLSRNWISHQFILLAISRRRPPLIA